MILDRLGGVMGSMLVSSGEGSGFNPQPGQTSDIKFVNPSINHVSQISSFEKGISSFTGEREINHNCSGVILIKVSHGPIH